jgi:2-dehydropantoate 2-reductase
VIYGAGAIGGTIGAKLFQSGREVALIARGAHLEVCRTKGLTLRTPGETLTQQIPAFGAPSEAEWTGDEVVILAMKSQDTLPALEALREAAGDVPVVCAQNGVANERTAARIFSRVYGMVVWMPSTHLQPGRVVVHSAPIHGGLDTGCYPTGVDGLIETVAADLCEAGFESKAQDAIMRFKYTKLLSNLGNSVQALCGDSPAGEIVRRLRDEALAVYEAAKIDCASDEELAERRRSVNIQQVEGEPRSGGSTWQSMTRGTPLETDYLNGEIALLGALHGVPTPVNRLMQFVSAEAARLGHKPGDYTAEDLLARLPG